MLIRITDRCHQSCLHCAIDASGPDGAHMDQTTFRAALTLADRLGAVTRLLSGGEPTLHPDFLDYMKTAQKRKSIIVIASNGSFLKNYQYTKAIYGLCGKATYLQITSDKRYYRERATLSPLPAPEHVVLIDKVELIFPCRRTRENRITPTRKNPSCFNLRSAVQSMHKTKRLSPSKALAEGLIFLERQHGRVCAPSINADGTVRAGEFDTCHKIGTVHDSLDTLGANLLGMKCDYCGLFEKLSDFHKAAVS